MCICNHVYLKVESFFFAVSFGFFLAISLSVFLLVALTRVTCKGTNTKGKLNIKSIVLPCRHIICSSTPCQRLARGMHARRLALSLLCQILCPQPMSSYVCELCTP